LALFAHAPFPIQRVRDIFDGLALERIDGDNGHLDARGLFDAPAVILQLSPRACIEHIGEVADVTLRLQRIQVKRKERDSEQAYRQKRPQQFAHFWIQQCRSSRRRRNSPRFPNMASVIFFGSKNSCAIFCTCSAVISSMLWSISSSVKNRLK